MNAAASFNLTEQEAWFAPLAGTIGDMAKRHKLLLEKYYHQSPAWDLRFNHPLGGQASITVSNGGSDAALVESVWHLDDYDQFTRFLHRRPARSVSREPDSVRRELEIEFDTILKLPLGQWNQVATGYEKTWGRFGKTAFQGMAPKYPDPVP